jgi:hypothetical protein
MSIEKQQDAILSWLKSLGHRVEFDIPAHTEPREYRSCLRKRRYATEPSCSPAERAYSCRFCFGWHKATNWKNVNGQQAGKNRETS